jgi:hypothetical protein
VKDKKVTTKHALPKGMVAGDLQSPPWNEAMRDIPYEDRQFEMWYTTGFGWCIPTLSISSSGYRSGRTGSQRRTYAVTVDGGKVVRIGAGPHVLEIVLVHNRPSRRAALQPFLDLRTKGSADAGQVRDRISSRRVQGQMERAAGNRYWRWDV